ncbi:DNA-binding XRE family transcriptional regulator [Actinocorallia herbida]|uniref:DNA-binding XRE family transcriptional regulator n=2 Tax=Actinocorallia herbida TaxID=58109 RepID=A0A3N1CMY1_9ACTN|nr:DNA-binding XRE family transcriptional regulator [Actinocorallia herbida]ROO82670.1 DNA-binding XRE family transcriptional regulator [Actinocorallia herbida]
MRIVVARTAAGMSQTELGLKAGVNPASVTKLEKGQAGLDVLHKVVSALGLTLNDVLPEAYRQEPARLYTPEETAERLGNAWSPTTLRRKAGAQEISHTKLGKEIRFSDRDIAEIIQAFRRPALTHAQRAHRRRSRKTTAKAP